MESSDMHGLVDRILRQLQEAGERAARAGMLITLPLYFDAVAVQALQQDINRQSVRHYDLTHRRGERRVWVQLH